MWDWMNLTTPVAKKSYHCQASDWIDNSSMSEADFSPEDWEVIKKARSEGSKILPGTRYIKISGKWDGDFCVFRAREDLDSICNKYSLYDE